MRYALPARLASRYAPVERGLHLVAVRSAPEPRAWIAPLGREGSFDPEASGGEPARGALVVDPRALLGLPGEEAEYAVVLWIEELASPVLRVRLPASGEAAPAPPEPPVGLGISELTREVGDAPVLRAVTGCLSFAVDVASGDEPLLVAVAAPRPARARAFVVERPHGYAPSMAVTVRACELFLPLPEERLHAFALALRGDDVATLALDPALPPASARPIAVPACNEDGECVLVTGGCMGPAATHRDVAAAVDERHRLILSVAQCSGAVPRVPVRAVCRARTCTTEPQDHPEWRGCRRDRDCTVEWRHCHLWEPIATSAAEAAHAAWVGPECPGIAPVPPPVRCVRGSCTIGWAGP
ncbi:MAG: hypothetical protein M5U28_46490 [Sandaracinaceae bacterium]|nr:hypothetical protein [Sandaracinaceae bacterium]